MLDHTSQEQEGTLSSPSKTKLKNCTQFKIKNTQEQIGDQHMKENLFSTVKLMRFVKKRAVQKQTLGIRHL